MLQKSINFIHNFDERVHHALNYTLDVYKDKNLHVHDSVHNKKCGKTPGRWNFIANGKDFSCAIYESLEMIRHVILSAISKNQNKVDFVLVSPYRSPNKSYVINDQSLSRVIDIERLKNEHLFSQNERVNHSCKRKISNKLFFSLVKPVLKQLLEKQNFRVSVLSAEKEVSEKVGQIMMHFKRDLPLIRIEWGD